LPQRVREGQGHLQGDEEDKPHKGRRGHTTRATACTQCRVRVSCLGFSLPPVRDLSMVPAGCQSCAHKDQVIGSLQKQVYDLQSRLTAHEQPSAPPASHAHHPHLPHPFHHHQHHSHNQPGPSLPPRRPSSPPKGTSFPLSPFLLTLTLALLQQREAPIRSLSTFSTPAAPLSPVMSRRCATACALCIFIAS
jgi:hypothetical protein